MLTWYVMEKSARWSRIVLYFTMNVDIATLTYDNEIADIAV